MWTPGTPCGLTFDVPLDAAVAEGDWISTDAGARYLVTAVRRVQSKRHAQRNRYSLRVMRLARDLDVPDDVHCWQLVWYPRG